MMRLGPTSANTCPARIVFLRTPEAKARLIPALSPGNVDKTKAAPVTAIIGWDTRFYELLPKLFPHRPEMKDNFANNPTFAETTGFRNGTLQGAYFMIAARACGLDVGGMSGFDNAKVDAEFFPDGRDQVELPLQRRPRRSRQGPPQAAAPRLRRGVHPPVSVRGRDMGDTRPSSSF